MVINYRTPNNLPKGKTKLKIGKIVVKAVPNSVRRVEHLFIALVQ
jgi:hypothetical protein